MVTKETLLKDLYKGTKLEKYARYFYYGFDGPEWVNNPIGHYCEGLWGNEDTIKALNNFEEYFNKGKVETIYLDKKKPDINLTIIKQNKLSKFALVLAGGGYCSVATAVEGLPIGEYLYQKGFTVGYLTYSINSDARDDGSYHDLILAMNYLFKNQKHLNIDMNNYIVGGCSAGAHLAARLGTSNCGYKVLGIPKPGLLFLSYPVVDFGQFGHTTSINMVLGKAPTQEQVDRISIHKNVDKDFPPCFLWQCERDNIVPFKNSLMLDSALNRAGVKHMYKTYDSDAHGWGLATGHLAEHWVDEMLDFYKKVVL